MKRFKNIKGEFSGSSHPSIAKLNNWVELGENDEVYVTEDNALVVSDVVVKGALLLSDRPSDEHKNVSGKWVKPDVKAKTVSDDLSSPINRAWQMLTGNVELEGSWSNLKSAHRSAVEALGEDATADEIYAEAAKQLES